MFWFIAKSTKYKPRGCGSISGTIYCEFVIEKDGSITNIKIIRALEPSLDQNVVETMKKMPNWKPAKINNQPVRCKMILPFKFTLR